MPQKVLPLSMRPRWLDQMLGQRKLITSLRSFMKTRPPSAIMFIGPSGNGKTTAAKIVALSLQCDHQEIFGRPCKECWLHWDDFAIHEVNASSETGKEEIGQLVHYSKFDPTPPSHKRVIVLDEAQRLSKNAQDLLLVPTENIPPNTVWIISSSEPNKLVTALQRRFTTFTLESMNTDERLKMLLNRAAKFTSFTAPLEPLIEQIKRAEMTSSGFILNAFEQFANGRTAVDAVTAALNTSSGATDTFALCKAVASGHWADVRLHLRDATLEESRWIRGSVSGYLRGWLMRESNPVKCDKLAIALRDLLGPAPLEDAQMFPWLCATLYKICRTLRT